MSEKLKTYGIDVEKAQTVRMTLTINDLRRMVGAPDNASVSVNGSMLKSTDKVFLSFTSAEAFSMEFDG